MDRCLYCNQSLEHGATLIELLINHDVLCPMCRHELIRNKKKFSINNIPVDACYIYNDFFSSLLVQYKDCMDEALKSVFLFNHRLIFHVKYWGYTLVPMPSSKDKIKDRGFNHVLGMFEWCKNEKYCCLEKTSNQKQVTSTSIQRQKMIGNIRCTKDVKHIKKILLIDDVCTTGSTLKGALEALSSFEGKIKIFVIATHPLNLKKIVR